jgi:hypothetical protein
VSLERKFIKDSARLDIFDLEMTKLMHFYDKGPCAGR